MMIDQQLAGRVIRSQQLSNNHAGIDATSTRSKRLGLIVPLHSSSLQELVGDIHPLTPDELAQVLAKAIQS